jgi:hypothetical protein
LLIRRQKKFLKGLFLLMMAELTDLCDLLTNAESIL